MKWHLGDCRIAPLSCRINAEVCLLGCIETVMTDVIYYTLVSVLCSYSRVLLRKRLGIIGESYPIDHTMIQPTKRMHSVRVEKVVHSGITEIKVMVEWLSLLTTILFQASSRGHIRGPYYYAQQMKEKKEKNWCFVKENQHCGGSSNAKESRHALEQVSINSDSPGRGQRWRRGPKFLFNGGKWECWTCYQSLSSWLVLSYSTFRFPSFTSLLFPMVFIQAPF